MGALDQFKNMGKEPQLGDSEKVRQDNDDYNKPLNKSLEEQKKDLMDSLYLKKDQKIAPEEIQELADSQIPMEEDIKENHHNSLPDMGMENIEEDLVEGGTDFGAPGIPEGVEIESLDGNIINEIPENQEDKNQIENINKTKEYPLVKKYLDERNLDSTNLKLGNDDKIDINSIEGLSIDDKKTLEGLFVNLDGDNREQNLLDFSADLKGVEEFSGFNIETNNDGYFDTEVLNLIGKNYIKIPDLDNNLDKKADISIAIEATSKDILKEVKNIPECQTKETALKNISSGDLNKQIEGINSLYVLAYSNEGKLAKKEVNSYKEKRKGELKNKAVELTKHLKQANESGDEKQIKILEEEKANLIKEAKEITSGEVFEAGDIDKNGEKDPLGQLENK